MFTYVHDIHQLSSTQLYVTYLTSPILDALVSFFQAIRCFVFRCFVVSFQALYDRLLEALASPCARTLRLEDRYQRLGKPRFCPRFVFG